MARSLRMFCILNQVPALSNEKQPAELLDWHSQFIHRLDTRLDVKFSDAGVRRYCAVLRSLRTQLFSEKYRSKDQRQRQRFEKAFDLWESIYMKYGGSEGDLQI